jgi:hypothetical protein
MPEFIDDDMLGRLSREWIYAAWTWAFVVTLPGGADVPANMLHDPEWDPLGEESLPRIRALAGWLRENEPTVRARVAGSTFDEWRADYAEPQQDGITLEWWAAALRLAEVTFLPDGEAHLVYLFDTASGPRSIWLVLDEAGAFAVEPGFPW